MKPEFVARYGDLERQHFWHRARRLIVWDVLRRFSPPLADGSRRLLDVGCGAGTNLAFLRDKHFACVGIEPDPTLLAQARAASGVPVLHLGLPLHQPLDSRFDVILLLDVLEHVDDDQAALVSLKQQLTPQGLVLLNVPAHPGLWSALDEVNQHRRRYTKSSLQNLLAKTGYRVRYLRFWGSLGCPLIFLQRRILWSPQSSYESYIPPPTINTVLSKMLLWEFMATKQIPLPFGVSLLAVAEPVR